MGGGRVRRSSKADAVARARLSFQEPMKEPYYATTEAVLAYYGSDGSRGISAEEAEARRLAFGRNMLQGGKTVHPVIMFLGHLFNTLTLILFMALALSLAVQEWIESAVLLFVIITNAIIGFLQEYSSEQTMAALRRLSSPLARVVRAGIIQQVPADELVLGDIIHLEDGDQVPADVRVTLSVAFATEEAILTGESVAVNKVVEPMDRPVDSGEVALPVGDRKNMAFFGCAVSRGRATGVVTGVGMQTELGKIAKSIEERTSTKTVLQRQLDRLAMGLFVCAIILGFIVIAVNKLSVQHEVLLYAIALGVSIIPEGLVAVVTVTMAIGVKRMATANTIVRKLVALEALGAVTDICSDKTGTLTMAKMVASDLWLPSNTSVKITGVGLRPVGDFHINSKPAGGGQQSTDNGEGGTTVTTGALSPAIRALLRVCALCNTASISPPPAAARGEDGGGDGDWIGMGDSTEVALVVLSIKGGMEKATVCKKEGLAFFEEYPFDSTIKRMSVAYQRASSNEVLVFSKGAIESIYTCCDKIRVGDEEVPLVGAEYSLESLQRAVDNLAQNGLRVLALAMKVVPAASFIKGTERDVAESGLTFLGLVGIYDPPRVETLGAVRTCRSAGITVRMVTGDHPSTAAFIAREVEIITPEVERRTGGAGRDGLSVMAASRFDQISDDDLDRLPALPHVVARCSPATKVKLIQALHRRGKVVAMTGDGVNDAPSLKTADVGIAMGINGSDVTKQAADIVLTDDNFATIEKAVEEGRRISSNIVKFVIHLMCANVAEVFALVIGLVFLDSEGFSVYPMSPLQILWINMVTSSPPALGLACEPAEPDVMQRPPTGRSSVLLSPPVIVDTLYYGFIIGVLSLVNFVFVAFLDGDGVSHTKYCNKVLSDECEHLFRARAASFGTMTLLLLLHAYNCKNLRLSITKMSILDNKLLMLSVVLGIFTMVPTFYIPYVYDKVFYQAPIDWEWGIILGAAVIFVSLSELYKAYLREWLTAAKPPTLLHDDPRQRDVVIQAGGIELVIHR